MKEKYTTLLLIYTMLLFMVACSGSEPMLERSTDSPSASSATPEAEQNPLSPNQRVKIRLENISGLDFEQIELELKGHSEQFAGLAAGERSDFRAVEEAYQSVYVKLMAGGQAYVLEGLDAAGEAAITGGSYTYQLDIRDGNLLLDLMPEREPGQSSLATITEALQAAGATVSYEPSIQRKNIFDDIFGYTVATREFLRVNERRVVVYVFDDAATAKEASETIEPGGTSFTYTREDGTREQKFWDGIIGRSPKWWLSRHFIISHGELQPVDEPTVALINETLQATAIHSPASQAAEVQIRIINISPLDFESVVINFLGQEVDYGAVPSGKQSSYQTAKEAYRYAWVQVEADGETYEITPIDYVGERPLVAGQYSYVLDIARSQLQMTYFREDKTRLDPDLAGSDWYWLSAQLEDNSRFFPVIYEEHPSIRFTTEADANAPGLHFEGYDSCNWIGGAYHVNQYHALVIDGIGMTLRECEAPDSEAFFLDILRGINYYSVESDYLFLFSGTGEMMTFTRQQPTSEPPYATDSRAAIAPIVQAIRSQAGAIEVTRLSPSDDGSSNTRWNLNFFNESLSLYVFDDTAAAEKAIKSIQSSENPSRLWQDGRFLISYHGNDDLIYDMLDDIFAKE